MKYLDPYRPLPTWLVILIMVVVALAIGALVFLPGGSLDG